MTATILPFPTRAIDADRLVRVGELLKTAIPIAPRDAELDILLQMGGKLLDNLDDYDAVDVWLARLNVCERRTMR